MSQRLKRGCVASIVTLLLASCHDEPAAPSGVGPSESGSEVSLPPTRDAGSTGPRVLCRTDDDCPPADRCCMSGLFGICSPLEPGRECTVPDLTLTLPPDFKPRLEYRLFEEGDCLLEKCVSGPGARRLLRFPLEVVNRGNAPMILALPDAPGVQRIACDGSLFLADFLRYELIDAQRARRAGGVGDAALACRAGILAAPTSPFDCETLGLEEHSYRELASEADCQWVDVTTLPPGEYTLRLSVNADYRLKEATFANNVVERTVTIPPADPLAPCDPEDLPEGSSSGANVECGWEMLPEQTGLVCQPGAIINLACTFCGGAYLPRACPDLEPCSAAGSLPGRRSSWGTNVCSWAEQCSGPGYCNVFDFECPASGVYSLLGFPTDPFDPFSVGPVPVPQRMSCQPIDPDEGSAF